MQQALKLLQLASTPCIRLGICLRLHACVSRAVTWIDCGTHVDLSYPHCTSRKYTAKQSIALQRKPCIEVRIRGPRQPILPVPQYHRNPCPHTVSCCHSCMSCWMPLYSCTMHSKGMLRPASSTRRRKRPNGLRGSTPDRRMCRVHRKGPGAGAREGTGVESRQLPTVAGLCYMVRLCSTAWLDGPSFAQLLPSLLGVAGNDAALQTTLSAPLPFGCDRFH